VLTAADLLPMPEWGARHEVEVAAPPQRALAAARAVTPRELRVAGVLLALRGMGLRPGAPLLDGLLATPGFTLLDETPTSLAFAFVGQPWRPWGGGVAVGDLRAFDRPGYIRVAADFLARDGLLATETRIQPTDAAARRRFALYWAAVRPGSGLLRREWLAAAKRRAERG